MVAAAQRRICAVVLLSARRVHSFRPIREHEARRLLSSVATAGKPVNLTERLKEFTVLYSLDHLGADPVGDFFIS